MISDISIRKLFIDNNIRVTSQRVHVYKALQKIGHACAEDIIELLLSSDGHFSTATVYNVLNHFADKGIISRVNTGNNKMYFDITTSNHPHIYCTKSHKIVDYFDEELNKLIESHFENRKIEGFNLSQIKVQFIGNFD